MSHILTQKLAKAKKKKKRERWGKREGKSNRTASGAAAAHQRLGERLQVSLLLPLFEDLFCHPPPLPSPISKSEVEGRNGRQ